MEKTNYVDDIILIVHGVICMLLAFIVHTHFCFLGMAFFFVAGSFLTSHSEKSIANKSLPN